MNARLKLKVVMVIVASLAAVLLLSTSALGQCSMCRAALAGSNAAFIKNFNIGVLVLLVPPVTIFCSIFIALKRHRSTDEEDGSEEHSEPSETNEG